MTHDDQAADELLKKRLQADALPLSPSSLERKTRQRIQERQARQLLVRTAATGFGVVALCYSLQRLNFAPQPPQNHHAEVAPLSDHELASLFAPPPVDPLVLLDRQQQASYQSLKQLERSR